MFYVAIWENGQLVAHIPVVADNAVIGRSSSCDIVIARAQVSARHMMIVASKSGPFVIVDQKSTNGTWISGVRIAEPTPVADGDPIRIAQLTVSVAARPIHPESGYFNLLCLHDFSAAQGIDRTINVGRGVEPK